MKAIIFGINSQDGFFLSEICKQRAIEVVGVSRTSGEWLQGSVSDQPFTEQLIGEVKPNYIFHLAANSSTRHEVLYENNLTINSGTIYIMEAARRFAPSAKVFITGSGLQFKNLGKPIRETDAFEANSAYSMSRIQSVYAARYFRSVGLSTYVGYLFHHESPMRKEHHMSKVIAEAAKRIMSGSKEKITIGDISVQKEWAYSRDIAEGIFTLVTQDRVSEATIGTGITYSIEDWLTACFQIAGKSWQDHVVLPGHSFKAEYPVLVSDSATMHSIGWRPRTSFSQLSQIMMQ